MSTTLNMKRAKQADKSIIIQILSRAFDENKSVNFVVKQGLSRKARVERLMEYSFNVCYASGEVWISDDAKGCALMLFPDRKRTTIKTILWDIKLALSVVGVRKVNAVMDRETTIKAYHPRDPFCYLWFIGVDPDHQCKGIGSELLKEIIEEAERRNRSIYLETSVENNLSWYRKFGFELFHELYFSYKLYLLRRFVSR